MTTYTDMLASYGVTIARPGGFNMTKEALNLYPIKGEHVLEIGCGLGETANYLTNKFDVHVTAVDNHLKMIEKAKKRNNSKLIDWIHQDILNYQPAHSFNICIVESVLSFTDVRESLRKIHSLLTEEGTLYLLEPIYLGGLTKEEFDQYKSFYQFQSLLTKEQWRKSLRETGFHIVDTIHSYDVEQNEEKDVSYPDLELDENLDSKYINILSEHTELTSRYLAYFDYAYFICKKNH